MNERIAQIKNLTTGEIYDSVEAIPEIKNFIAEKNTRIEEALASVGIDAQAEYAKAKAFIAEGRRVEALNIEKAMKQAIRDAKANEVPCVFHRRNNCPWYVTMTLEDWISLYKQGEK